MRNLPYIALFAGGALLLWYAFTVGLTSFTFWEFSPVQTWEPISRFLWFIVGVPLTTLAGLFGYHYGEEGR